MLKTIQKLAVLLLLLYAGNANAQLLSVREMQSDFDSLRSALEEVHGGLYRYSTKKEMDNIFHRSRLQLNKPMTKLQFIAVISGLLPQVRDGHLRLELDAATASKLSNAKLFPLQVITEGSKLMVLFNGTKDNNSIQPGMEIMSINGHSSKDLVQLLLSKISDDGFIETGKLKRIDRNFAMLYWMLVDTGAVYTVHSKDANGKIIKATLSGVLTADKEKNINANPVNTIINNRIAALKGKPDNISLQLVNRNTATLRIKSFGGENFYSAIDSVFRLVHNEKTKALILDLRGNGGGVDEYGAYLVAQFMDHSFRYFDHIRLRSINPSFTRFKQSSLDNLAAGTIAGKKGEYLVTTKLHTGVGKQAPGKNPFTGKLVVLMDGGTFSTAADVMALLKHLTNAIFVGEESGGGYEGNTSGSSARFIFPWSKLVLNVNMYDYYNAVKPAKNKGRGTMPDYTVVFKINELLKGNDVQMNKALSIAKEN